VPSRIGNVNLPARPFQVASLVDSTRRAYANGDDALAFSRGMNGVCHRSLTAMTLHGSKLGRERRDGAGGYLALARGKDFALDQTEEPEFTGDELA
jgi:hypothetical protein